MVTYLLDTDICIFWLRGNTRIKEKLVNDTWGSMSICPITLAELYVGAFGSKTPQAHLAQIEAFAQPLHLAPLSDAALRRFGQLKPQLKHANKLIGDFDLLIASIALVEGLTLVTNNAQHYERIPDLKMENWIAVS